MKNGKPNRPHTLSFARPDHSRAAIRSFWQLVFLFLALLASRAPVRAQTAAFTYQGRLLENGQPANGTYSFKFALMNAAVNGSQAGPLLTNGPVSASNGLFSVLLDFGAAAFDGSARWLEIAVRTNGSDGAFAVLNPRQAITASPYATYAASAGLSFGLVGGGIGLTNVSGAGIQAGTLSSNAMNAALWGLVTNGAATLSAFLTPYECGAVGDGATDDTVALQCWINRATASNLVAFLPAARGAYYKITSALLVTNLNGLRLVGAGGQAHLTAASGAWSRSQLRQFTLGESGIVIKDNPSGGLTDSIVIEGIVLAHNVAGNQSNSASWGIGFDGNLGNTDGNLIQACGVFGFGRGIHNSSGADVSIISCAMCNNADGIFIGPSAAHPAPVVNSIKTQTSQLSYNLSNQVHVATGGTVIFDTCDIASEYPSSVGARIEDGATTFLNCNFEHSGSNAAIIATSQFYRTFLTMQGGSTKDEGGYHPYSICATNSYVTLLSPGLYAADANGVPILICNQYDGYLHLSMADAGWPVRFIVGAVEQSTNTIGSSMTGMTHGPPAPLPASAAGQLYSGQLTGNAQQSDLWYIARMGAYYGSNSPTAVSLLQYQKDKTTSADFNAVTASSGYRIGAVSWTSGAGSPEGVVTAPIGSLYTRTDGGPGATLYVKESGLGNTGWTAK